MTQDVRLRVAALMILVSALYAVLVANDPATASAISSGYVALFLTVFAAVNIRKKP